MPGRPAIRKFLSVGPYDIFKDDEHNWSVRHTDEDYHYFGDLPGAIKFAVKKASDAKSKDAKEWLQTYQKLVHRLEQNMSTLIGNL